MEILRAASAYLNLEWDGHHMRHHYTIGLMLLALLLAGCVGGTSSADPGTAPADNETTGETAEDASGVTVTYTASGFSPERVTIEQGETVTWVNEGGPGMWVATDVHPSHSEYDGTSLRQHCQDGSSDTFDACQTTQEYSFTFEKNGTFPYHNHRQAGHVGTVVVE